MKKLTKVIENQNPTPDRHTNTVFRDCVFDDLRGLVLEDCVLGTSKFSTDSIKKALGFTITLDCFSFDDVEYSPLLIDLLLYLLTITKGNDEKREQIKKIIGPRYEALARVLRTTE